MRPWQSFYPPGVPASANYPDVPVWGLLEHAADVHPERLALIDGEMGSEGVDIAPEG